MKVKDLIELDKKGELSGSFDNEDVSNEDYHAGPAISSSGLKLLLADGPDAFKHCYIDGNRTESTPAMALGTALHCAVLEPDKYKGIYVSDKDAIALGSRRTNAYKAKLEQLSSGGKVVLPEDDLEKVKAMRDNLLDCPAGQFLFGGASTEKSIYWKEDEILCKVRLDSIKQVEDYYVVCDIKTTSKPLREFNKQILNFGYHTSAAMYALGVERVLNKPVKFVWAVVSTKPPYSKRFVTINNDSFETGYDNFRKGLKLYKQCLTNGVWPSYKEDYESGNIFEEISIPHWAIEDKMYKGGDNV